MSMITVGISDLNVAKGEDILVTYALGSCVGICLYDRVTKIAGLSHIMLPCSVGFAGAAQQPYKFADSAIPLLIQKMKMAGAMPMRFQAKIAGGAQMFAARGNTSLANIGERNVIAVKQELARLKIPIIAQDTGKNYGRTLFFSAADGVMKIKSVNRGEFLF